MAQKADSTGKQKGHQTLGGNVRPSRYAIDFTPNLKTFKYSASETIHVYIGKSTDKIALNAKELVINSARVSCGDLDQKAKVSYDYDLERIVLSLAKPVSGEADIRIEFSGIHNDQMYGFYRSMYRSKGKAKYILSSQFEAANARNAFPCFDEPEFKAVFDVSLTVDKDLDCISNMPISSSAKAGKGLKKVQFQATPVMSSYLLYLGVGNYDYVHGNAGRVKVRVITTPGNRALARLPMKYAIDFIKFFEKYFGIDYPLPKADFIAIPDFAAGAMENWGAITFREAALLIDEKSSIASKQRVAEVIAHELTHQWFGDLVTMKWWNDLWLNESFATFMSYKAMDAVFPKWNVKIDYLTDVIAVAFAADQLKSTHPISVHVDSPAQIDQIFDEISYEKGGTVLNMLEDYAGKETFRRGLHGYLKANSYSNATKSDLWDAIDRSSGRSSPSTKVHEVADYWIENPGYPIISVQRAADKLRLSQKRFFLLGDMPSASLWPIPINYLISGRKVQVLMDKKEAAISVQENDWIKLNAGQNGLYRVAYGPDDLSRLGGLIQQKKMSGVDSWGVEQDIFSRARSASARAGEYLDFVDRYCLGAEYPLSSNVLGHLGWIYGMLYYANGHEVAALLDRYSHNLMDRLGWKRNPHEPTFDTYLRASAISESAMAGNASTIERARQMFEGHVNGKEEIDPNLRGAIYYINVWTDGRDAWNVMREKFEKETIPEEKNRLLRAVSSASDPRVIIESLDYSLSDKVRLQDAYAIPAITSSTPVGRKLILDWTTDNWAEIKKRYASGTHMLGRYVANLGTLSSMPEREKVSEFFSSKQNYRPDIKQALDKALEQIEANSRFMQANNAR